MSAYAFIVYRRSGVDAQLASHVLMDNGLLRGLYVWRATARHHETIDSTR